MGDLRQEFGLAMVFVPHDPSVIQHVCDEVIAMHPGRIMGRGPDSAVIAPPHHFYARALQLVGAGHLSACIQDGLA